MTLDCVVHLSGSCVRACPCMRMYFKRHQSQAIFLRGLCVLFSASTSNIARIEEMERLLKQAHAEKTRLLESRVGMLSLCGRSVRQWFILPARDRKLSWGLRSNIILGVVTQPFWPLFFFFYLKSKGGREDF